MTTDRAELLERAILAETEGLDRQELRRRIVTLKMQLHYERGQAAVVESSELAMRLRKRAAELRADHPDYEPAEDDARLYDDAATSLAQAEADSKKAALYDRMQEVAKANGYDCLTDAIAKAKQLTRAQAEIERLQQIDIRANRTWRAISGLNHDDLDKRADSFAAQWLDGFPAFEASRGQLVGALADNFSELRKDTAVRAQAEIAGLRAALTKIACFDDGLASDRLESNGSYALFDEPGSVEIARTALSALSSRQMMGKETSS